MGYVRAEFQHAPATPALTLEQRMLIARLDQTPLAAPVPGPEVNRIRLLDAYVGYQWRHWQVSFGQQSLWWGPGQEGALMLSDNAEPILMFRVSRSSPMLLPGFLSRLGPLRMEFFGGRLSGHKSVRTSTQLFSAPLDKQPLIHGEKLNMKPTKNLDIGISFTTVFGGPGYPINLRTVARSFGFSNTNPGLPNDPGDRRAGFDFKYRVPGLRRWLTLYVDSFTEDEISPLAFPRRSAFQPGLYLPVIPKLHKLDLRIEGVYTALPNLRALGTGYYYSNSRFLNGYTNQGVILGHWIGREGVGFNVKSSYHAASTMKWDFAFKTAYQGSQYLDGGGRLSQFRVGGRWATGNHVSVQGSVTVERWRFPVLSNLPQLRVVPSLEVRYTPRK